MLVDNGLLAVIAVIAVREAGAAQRKRGKKGAEHIGEVMSSGIVVI